MKHKNSYFYIKHYFLLFVGIIIMAMSVALAKIATLGTSPISSVPNVLSIITPLTIGQTTIIFMTLVIVLEAVVLGKNFNRKNVVQIVPTIVFGELIDLFIRIFGFIDPHAYWVKLCLTIISIGCLAIGVFFEVNSRTIMMAGEGIAAAFAFRLRQPFAKMKVRADITMVVMAVILSVIFTQSLVGVREGTILSAIFTGRILGLIEDHMPAFTKWVQN